MLVIAPKIAICALLVLAAAHDVHALRIPNPIPLTLVALFGTTALVGLEGPLLPHLTSFAIAAFVGVGLYSANIWGGGDAKLLATFALFLSPGDLSRFALITALAGGVVAGAMLIGRRLAAGPVFARANVPYGLALATGGLDWCLLH